MLRACFLLFTLMGCRQTLTPSVPRPRADPSAAWGQLLQRAVGPGGYVDYGLIGDNRRPLDAYVAWIARENAVPGKGGTHAHAFWLNAFNALAIYQVLERGRPGSVCDVPSPWPWRCAGFFWATDFNVGRNRLSLWEIGNERVITAQQDVRDLAALNVAARSAPPLLAGLYTADDLRTQLTTQMRRWLMDDRGVRIEDGEAVFNPAFHQYDAEIALFTHGEDLCALASQSTVGPKQRALASLAEAGCPHRFFDFDWQLNQAR